jgi:hypothetical protein
MQGEAICWKYATKGQIFKAPALAADMLRHNMTNILRRRDTYGCIRNRRGVLLRLASSATANRDWQEATPM